jgi:minor curlin subunit
MPLRLLFAAVGLLAASSAASALDLNIQTVTQGLNSQVVVEVGNQVQPVTINQSSPVNVTTVVQVSSGSTSATTTQTGTTNVTGIRQFGTSNSATIGQFGAMNTAVIGQVGSLLNSSVVVQSTQ